MFDREGCSRALSLRYMEVLDVSVQKYLEREGGVKCYIDPHVSLGGEGLEDVKVEIERRLNDVLVQRGGISDNKLADGKNFSMRE